MSKKILSIFVLVLCFVWVTPTVASAEEQYAPGLMGKQGLEQTKQSLQQALQSGDISQEEYDIAMADVKRMEALSSSDQKRINRGLQSWKE